MTARQDWRAAVLVFAKAPRPGAAKTRLAPLLGEGGAAVLAARLVRRTLETACAAQAGEVTLCCAPDTDHEFFALCARRHGVRLEAQGDGDLGERMHRAFVRALASSDAALLVGTDVPHMTGDDLRVAITHLRNGADAVLGPAEDGGYWLVGLRRPDARVFSGIAWSTASVAAQTRERMLAAGWRLAEVPRRADVDRPEDVHVLAREDATAGLVRDLLDAAARRRGSGTGG